MRSPVAHETERPHSTTESRAKPAPFPRRLEAQLAHLAARPPAGDNWLHEIKFDGYRMFCALNRGKARLLSRNHLDWTTRFPRLVQAASHLPAGQAVLDGEVVVLDEKGISNFQSLQRALDGSSPAGLYYFAFDLLYLDGKDTTLLPLETRKEMLEKLIDSSPRPARLIRFSDHVVGEGAQFLRKACRAGLEGTISKRRDGRYVPGRGHQWLKNKCRQAQEFVIGGFTRPAGSRIAFGALLLGYYAEKKLVYAGRVGTGFTTASLRDLKRRLDGLEQRPSPFVNLAVREAGRDVKWVRPKLVAQVEFANWTADGLLRQAAFQGLREDKPPQAVTRERPD